MPEESSSDWASPTLGLSLGTSIIMGLIAIGGSVVPLLLAHNAQISMQSGAGLLAGIGLMVIGLSICASRRKPEAHGSRRIGSAPGTSALGLIYCLAAGVLSALVNLALVFGAPIAQPAIASGVDPATANNAVWAIVFTVNYLVNIGYCLFRAARRGSLGKFRTDSSLRYWALAFVMGMLWAGGIVAYGRGASLEGPLGPVFGFPIMLITSHPDRQCGGRPVRRVEKPAVQRQDRHALGNLGHGARRGDAWICQLSASIDPITAMPSASPSVSDEPHSWRDAT